MKKSYLAIAAVLIIALGVGVFVCQKQGNQVQEQPKEKVDTKESSSVMKDHILFRAKVTGVEDLSGPYKKVTIGNGRVIFSFEVPDQWLAETRNSGEVEMNEEELRDFFATSYKGDIKTDPSLSGDYWDFAWDMLKDMSYDEMKKRYASMRDEHYPGYPNATVTSDNKIWYTDIGWDQVDFYILSGADKKYIKNAIRVDSPADFSKKYQEFVERMEKESRKDSNGKIIVNKGESWGFNAYFDYGSSAVLIRKEAYVEGEFEKGFEHIMRTFKKDDLAFSGTSDWKTYRNEKYGYSIDYPRSWFVEETEATSKDPYLRGGDEIGGDIYISNYSAPSKYSLGNVPADIFSVSLMVYRVDPSITYDEFIGQRDYEFSPENGDSKTELMLNGNKAVQLRMKTTDHPAGLDVIITLVHDSDKMFVLNYSANERSSDDKKVLAERLVRSFSLKNSISDWKAYRNEEYGIEFRYPEKRFRVFEKSDAIPGQDGMKYFVLSLDIASSQDDTGAVSATPIMTFVFNDELGEWSRANLQKSKCSDVFVDTKKGKLCYSAFLKRDAPLQYQNFLANGTCVKGDADEDMSLPIYFGERVVDGKVYRDGMSLELSCVYTQSLLDVFHEVYKTLHFF